MQNSQLIKEHAIDALGHFERFRDRFIGGEAAMSSAARTALTRWFQTADQAGPLRPKIVERAKPLMATIEDEILALGGPLERYGFGDETYIASGTYDGDTLNQLARPGRQYLDNASRVIHALEADRAIAKIRLDLATT